MFRSSIVAAALLWSSCASAGTLVEVTGPNDSSLGTTVLSNGLAVGFSLPAEYTNVSIGVSLLSFGGSGFWNLEAYLTTQLGPGTTAAAHEVASTSQLVPADGGPFAPPLNIVPYTVFSGLTLPAGNYYLTLGGSFESQNLWWAGSQNASLITNTQGGAAVIAHNLGAGVHDSYLPASLFGDQSATSGLWFTVTGDPVETSGVPEPATFLSAVGALLAFGIKRCLTLRVRSRS